MRGKHWCLLTVLGLTLGGCVNPSGPTAPPRVRSTPKPAVAGQPADGLRFNQTPGTEASAGDSSLPLAKTTPLNPGELKAMLAALPPIGTEPDDQKPFAMRPASQPPPRTARTLEQPFPPPSRPGPPPALADSALEVVSCTPQGAVEMAPQLQITFNQPMVAVTGLGDLKATDLPVRLTPQPAGKWRWLGTQTLMFQPELRFPMATNYELEVPAGTAAAAGAKLKEAKHFSFKTPTLTLESSYPNGSPQPLQPLLFMRFNQDIKPEAVAPMLKLRGNKEEVPIHLATRQEIVSDEAINGLVAGAGEKRSLVMALDRKLTPGQAYSLELPAGLPSLEGPLKTEQSQSFSFATYDPLRIVWQSEKVSPDDLWSINFNNYLDEKKFDPQWVQVTPELPGQKIEITGTHLVIAGRPKGRSQYQVSLSPRLLDDYGQTLGHEEKFVVQVTGAQPAFSGPSKNFVVLDPVGPRQLTCSVTNYAKLHVRAWKVGPEHWADYIKYLSTQGRNLKDEPTEPPGEKLLDQTLDTGVPADQVTELPIDLSKAFPQNLGQAIVLLEPQVPPKEYQPSYLAWVQSTQLGLDAATDSEQMLAWVSRLDTGAPLANVQVELPDGKATAISDKDGIARLQPKTSPTLLVARQGQDVAILPRDFNGWNSGAWLMGRGSDQELWHVVDDRHLYKPGEKVNLKGWLRHQQWGPEGDLGGTAVTQVNYSLHDSLGNEVSHGQARVGGLGGFHFEVSLPKTMNLGQATLRLSASNGATTIHAFEVQEFRRPEFEVSAEATPGSSQIGQSSVLSASASYFSGGPLANSKVSWTVQSSPTTYSPPGWEGYSFGSWTPWWGVWDGWGGGSQAGERGNYTTQETRTDSKGKSQLKVDFLSVDPPRPHSLTAQAVVADVNRQVWTANTSVLVHPAGIYVGLKSDTTFVEKGQPLPLSVVVTDLDGKPVAGKPVQLRYYRQEYDERGRLQEADEQVKQLTSEDKPGALSLPTSEGGTYRIEARVQDEQNRANACDLTVWVAGAAKPPSREVAQESVTLIPGKREYQAGDTAEVLAQAPFAPAEFLVTTRRNGIASHLRVSAPTGSTTLKIPLLEKQIPGLQVQVDAVGAQPREGGKGTRPAFATGSLTLNISRAPRQLTVTVSPFNSQLKPGGSTEVLVTLTDAKKQPVSGEVTLIAVDESVLALSGYDPADPLDTFCPLRPSDANDQHLRQFLELHTPGELEENEGRVVTGSQTKRESFSNLGANDDTNSLGRGGGAMEMAPAAPAPSARPQAEESKSRSVDKLAAPPPPPQQFKLRSNFAALAAFAPAVQTDATGRATIKVKLPDNLTRYRLIALAASGVKRFGKGESSLVARQPLQIRPSAPRFLNFGDHFELPVVLQNQTDQPMSVDLVCRGSNAVVGEEKAAGYRLQLKAQDRVEVRFPCAAAQAGTARFQFGANSSGGTDAAEVSLPVWTPATSEAFATYGVIDKGAARQPVQRPSEIFPQFGNLSITTSSTALSELADAMLYLVDYPFECSEQISSRALSAAALRDVLTEFKVPQLASPEQIEAAMKRDWERLRVQQNEDGGWDYWERDKPSIPYLTVHVAHTLVRLRSKGYKFEAAPLEQALAYLRDIESHLSGLEYSPACRRSIRAYALYVLNLSGHPELSKAQALIKEAPLEQLGPEVLAWILPTLAKDKANSDRIITHFENHSNQTAATAEFSFNYSDQGYLILYSDRRDDALILEALIQTRPKNPLIPKLVRGLLDHRTAGRWESTQENCWVLLALDAYFHKFENITPNFVANLWLGDDFVGQQAFRGREKDERAVHIPLTQVPEKSDLTIAKEGPGRLYYRIGMTYAPKALKSEALDNGFAVERSYEAVKDNQDVTRDAAGTWHFKAGALVRVKLTMQTPSRRYHVALVDPLPAGLEAVNPGLLGGETVQTPPQSRNDGWWSAYWFDHQNLRDERVEAFTQLLWEGVYQYSYVARATTPGQFVVPPTKAEEMYHPETFGRAHSDKVIVE